MDKRGQYDIGRKALYLILVVFFLAIMFIFLNTTFGKFDLAMLKTTDDATRHILVSEVFISPHCFTYVEPSTGRAFPGIFDMSKLNNNTIYKTCGKYYDSKFAAYIFLGKELENMSGNTLAEMLTLKKRLMNPEVYKIGKASQIYKYYFLKPILVKSGNQMERGALIVGAD